MKNRIRFSNLLYGGVLFTKKLLKKYNHESSTFSSNEHIQRSTDRNLTVEKAKTMLI